MNKEKSQLIGVMLLSLIFVTYFQYFGKKPSTPTSKARRVEATMKESLITKMKQSMQSPPLSHEGSTDSLILENEDVCIWLDEKGGMVKKVVLKKYKANKQGALALLERSNSYMRWRLSTQNGVVDTKDLVCTVDKHDNQVSFTYILDPDKKQYVKYTYTLRKEGYVLNCKVDTVGLNTDGGNALFEWYHAPENLEKDWRLNSNNTYVQYQSRHKGLKYLNKDKKARLRNVEWSAIKQRFFTSAIIAPKGTVFTHGELITQSAPKAKENTLMEVGMKLKMPLDGSAYNFTYYFGPNIYNVLRQVAPGFENNHYLGFIIPKYINKYIILPLANFLDSYTNHYVWVLLLLALFFILLRLYPAYKDYIITLKQKALQPALEKLRSNYKDKQKAKLAEINFYTTMGLPPSSFLVKIFLMLTEIPIFMAMIYFIPNNIALRQLSFLWTNDLSSADNLISFPFSIPLLGNHINLFALLMCISFLLRSRKSNYQNSASQNSKLFNYILPVAMFLGFNRYASAFCLYRILTDIISLLPPRLFKLFVNEDFHIAKVMKNKNQAPSTQQQMPRSIVRLGKKNNKKY